MPPTGMTPPIRGTCLCGQVSYECAAAPVWSTNCHCRSCQKLSGAPFVSAFSVPTDSFAIVGETLFFERMSASGHLVTTHHCSSCGTRICAQSAGAMHLMNVFASTLEDAANFKPISNVYLSEAVTWMAPPDAKYNFDRMPEALKRS